MTENQNETIDTRISDDSIEGQIFEALCDALPPENKDLYDGVINVAQQADQQLKDAHKRIAELEATINKLSPTGNSVIYVETPGDPDAGIFSHGFRFDIGFEIEDGEKEDFKEILSKAFSDVIGETAYIQFQCDIDKENEYFKQQLKPAEAE